MCARSGNEEIVQDTHLRTIPHHTSHSIPLGQAAWGTLQTIDLKIDQDESMLFDNKSQASEFLDRPDDENAALGLAFLGCKGAVDLIKKLDERELGREEVLMRERAEESDDELGDENADKYVEGSNMRKWDVNSGAFAIAVSLLTGQAHMLKGKHFGNKASRMGVKIGGARAQVMQPRWLVKYAERAFEKSDASSVGLATFLATHHPQ